MVLLIALLAVVRKFIVLEVPDVQPLTLIGLALTTLRTQCFQSRNECDGASTFDGCSIGNGEQAAPCPLATDWL